MKKVAMMVRLAVIVALTVLAFGCKEDKEGDLKKGSVSADKGDDLCSLFAQVVCQNAFQCCTGAQLEDAFGVKITTTEKTCRRDAALICQESYAQVLSSVDRGWVRVNLDSVDECLNWVLADEDVCFPYESYDTYSGVAACSFAMFEGQQAAGSDCFSSVDCKGEAICQADRKCHDLASIGEDCANTGCKSDGFCATVDTEGTKQCLALRQVGEDCNNYPKRCATGAYCDDYPEGTAVDTDQPYDLIPTGTCAALKDSGETCGDDMECITANCLPGVCQDGGACYEDGDCAGTCNGDGVTACDANNPCSSACVGGDNDGNLCFGDGDCAGTCSNSVFTTSCNTDADCVVSTCVDAQGLDTQTSCVSTTDCESLYGSGYTCVPQTGTCQGAGSCTETLCMGGACGGTPVCADDYTVIDYCERGLMLLGGGSPVTVDINPLAGGINK